MHENRETSGTSRSNQDRDRPEKANSRTADRGGDNRAVTTSIALVARTSKFFWRSLRKAKESR